MDLSEFLPQKVCFFDSGIGGLNLLYETAVKLPKTELYYFADNYKVPYGNLSSEELDKAVDKIFVEIAKINPSIAVIACNTVTARCAERLRRKYDFPIVGIQPAVKEAAHLGGKCVVFATPATAQSESLKRLIDNYGNNSTQVVACPKFAQFVEQNIFNLNEEELMSLLPDLKADTVVLGCTHYIFVKEAVQKKYGCPVFTGVDGTVRRILQLLSVSEGGQVLPRSPKITFIGGDEEKNKRVFYEVLCKQNGFWGNFSQKIPKNS
ncbi:MAG: glutamate racemase [Clostridia bacterium]|nr:glutamate racemase [Clostridia bacterium]